MMKVLVIGSGGREHALAWALSRSPRVTQLFTNSANAGMLKLGERVAASTTPELADFAAREGIDLTVIGPEQPLVDGLVDTFESLGLPVFGPSRAAARLEGSKIFAKNFMQRHRIPTAWAMSFNDAERAAATLRDGVFDFPVVIKADGLAAGKGVVIAEDAAQAQQAVQEIMVERRLGEAGAGLLIEECLVGREISYLIFSDGQTYSPLPLARDYKRALEGGRGPNTGGMGAFSVPGMIDPVLDERIRREIIEPSLAGARSEGFPFRGVLYVGLMLTADGPKVLEYNVRLGDPETQAVLRRLDSDLLEILLAVAGGRLEQVKPQWSEDASACVVLASGGYPGSYRSGQVITGLEAAEQVGEVVIFHAGTKLGASGQVETVGGRVLNVTARATSLEGALSRCYEAVGKISFEGAHFRRDIGQ